ncbi:hypothetical protein ACOBV8_21080 (plasmid) [Pseudoalteromonas espejiana]
MRKKFEFTVKNHKVKIINSWIGGAKLYIDGERRDHDFYFLSSGKNALLSANLGDYGVLSISKICSYFSEMDAFSEPECKTACL